MVTLMITLSDDQKAFVDARVKAAGLRSAGEYIASLIQLEQLKKERDKVDALLLEGLQSGPATPMTRRDWEDIERQGLARLAGEKHARTRSGPQRRPWCRRRPS